MQALRVLDRFPPSEAYLLTLISAQHLEMIREEQLLSYLDRGLGIANRDARIALLESALLRSSEIEELDHFLERKVERGPREFRAICRTMFTPSVERVLRATRNDDARRLTLEAVPVPASKPLPENISTSAGIVDEQEWDETSDRARPMPVRPWMKAAVAVGLLALVVWTVVMPGDKEHAAGAPPANSVETFEPRANDIRAIVRALFLTYGNQKDVVAQLKQDPYFTNAERELGLEYVQSNQQAALLLNNAAWFAIRYPRIAPHNAERCLKMALEACRLSPMDGMVLNTLGVAQYRVGQSKEAIDTLSQSFALNRMGQLGIQPADVAFLCMAYAQQNQPVEAKEQFNQLKALSKLKHWREDSECPAFLQEASAAMKQLDAKREAIKTE
ncbi:hypothetical protein BH10PLA2_BH10PLA2_23110 [soil metagenome]